MSALTLRLQKTIQSPSRVMIAVLGLTILSAVLIYMILQTVQVRKAAHVVSYGVQVITPLETEVCPGPRALSYPVTVIINQERIPDQGRIAEAWCRAGLDGICVPIALQGEEDVPLLAPKYMEAIAFRDVPAWLRPGIEYEFHHSVANAAGDVVGYIVRPIVVREDCP